MGKKEVQEVIVGYVLNDVLTLRADHFLDAIFRLDDLLAHLLDLLRDDREVVIGYHSEPEVVLVDIVGFGSIRHLHLAHIQQGVTHTAEPALIRRGEFLQLRLIPGDGADIFSITGMAENNGDADGGRDLV